MQPIVHFRAGLILCASGFAPIWTPLVTIGVNDLRRPLRRGGAAIITRVER